MSYITLTLPFNVNGEEAKKLMSTARLLRSSLTLDSSFKANTSSLFQNTFSRLPITCYSQDAPPIAFDIASQEVLNIGRILLFGRLEHYYPCGNLGLNTVTYVCLVWVELLR